MATIESVMTKIRNLISRSNSVTERTDTTLNSAVDALIDGYGKGGITPAGTKNITANGDYDVTEFATASVNIPASVVTPSGTKTITENGTHDVANYASALVNVSGLNAKFFTASLSADKTAETTFLTNDWFKSIRSDPNAFVLLRFMEEKASVAGVHMVFTANFPFCYGGTTVHNSIVARASDTTAGFNSNNRGLNLNGGAQYNGHLNIDANGRLYAYANATYPFKAGEYQIVAGILETV